jgi:hypothetical protein
VTDYVEKKEYTTMFDVLVNDILEMQETAERKGREAAQVQIQAAEQEKLDAIRRLRELGVSEEIIAASFRDSSGLR